MDNNHFEDIIFQKEIQAQKERLAKCFVECEESTTIQTECEAKLMNILDANVLSVLKILEYWKLIEYGSICYSSSSDGYRFCVVIKFLQNLGINTKDLSGYLTLKCEGPFIFYKDLKDTKSFEIPILSSSILLRLLAYTVKMYLTFLKMYPL